jgi:uroporphyrinogen-III decarboxylase
MIADKKETKQPTQAELTYLAREKRMWDATTLQKPDRVPIAIFDDYFLLSQGGITPRDAYYDPGRASEVYLEQVVKFDWDMVSMYGTFPGKVGEIVGLKSVKWAGYNLPDTQEIQYVEDEYMLADEYDLFLKNPSDFVIRTMWPRMATGLEPFSSFPPILVMADTFVPVQELASLAGRPEVRKMLEKLIKMGEEINLYYDVLDQTEETLNKMGVYTGGSFGGGAHAPFDWISDYFRGIKGSMLDMYYQPDKLKAAIDVVTPPIIEYAINTAKENGGNKVGMPLHRGSDSFMSNDQFAEFYWPSLKKVLMAIIDEDLTPFVYWEGSYTNRLEFLAELPPGKVQSHFEIVDKKKFKEVLGGKMCFWGDIPAQTLISGTPEQTSDYVRELIDTFSECGGLIVDGGMGVPKEAKLENVIAMTEAVFDYGVY